MISGNDLSLIKRWSGGKGVFVENGGCVQDLIGTAQSLCESQKSTFLIISHKNIKKLSLILSLKYMLDFLNWDLY